MKKTQDNILGRSVSGPDRFGKPFDTLRPFDSAAIVADEVTTMRTDLPFDPTLLPPLYEIAARMRKASPKVWGLYHPYFTPLLSMKTAREEYGLDSGLSVVLYAIGNWSGAKGYEAAWCRVMLKRHAAAAGATTYKGKSLMLPEPKTLPPEAGS